MGETKKKSRERVSSSDYQRRVVIKDAAEGIIRDGKQNDRNFLVQTVKIPDADIERCFREGRLVKGINRPLIVVMKTKELAVKLSGTTVESETFSIQRFGAKSKVKVDENKPGASQIVGQVEALMETVALSSAPSDPPPNLWHGTNGITIPLNVLHNPKSSGKFLSSGSFGEVYLHEDTNQVKIAIKIIPTQVIRKVKQPVEDVEKEVKIHSNLKHNNIIQYYGSHRSERHICIVMEYADCGSLKQNLENNGKVIGHRRLDFTKHIFLGLDYLHTLPNPIIHRDLRSANVLICGLNTAKLADFGISKQLETLHSTSGFDTVVGNAYWQAPEMIITDVYPDDTLEVEERMGKKVDVWSAGVVVLEMLHGKPPQSIHLNYNQYISKWVEYKFTKNDKELKDLLKAPEDLKNKQTIDVLSYCLEFKPSKRKTAAEILSLVWPKVQPKVHARPPAPVQERPSLELLYSALQQGSEAMRRHANEMQ